MTTTAATSMVLTGDEAYALAQRHGTPFYLYDMDAALAHLKVMQQAVAPHGHVFYCVKANANAKVLEAFKPHVAGLDLSSAGELELALKAGFDPKAMSFAGPGKSVEELEEAVAGRVGIVSVESMTELARLGAIAKKAGRVQDVTLRINPQSTPKEFNMKMGGPSQFGIAEELADDAIRRIQAQEGVRLVGIHVFAGTQCLEASALVANVKQTLDLAARLQKAHGFDPEVVNLGGGFGVAYFPGQEAMDHAALSRDVGSALNAFTAEHPVFGKTRFILELGRYLIGMFGVYVARCIDVKEARGKRFVILDGGMNHCFPATGNFGQLVKKNYPVKNLSKPENAALLAQEVVGPLCTPMDSMARAIELPKAEIDDLVAFWNCGAYSFGASPLLFLSHATPLELVKNGGQVAVGRERLRATRFA